MNKNKWLCLRNPALRCAILRLHCPLWRAIVWGQSTVKLLKSSSVQFLLGHESESVLYAWWWKSYWLSAFSLCTQPYHRASPVRRPGSASIVYHRIMMKNITMMSATKQGTLTVHPGYRMTGYLMLTEETVHASKFDRFVWSKFRVVRRNWNAQVDLLGTQ